MVIRTKVALQELPKENILSWETEATSQDMETSIAFLVIEKKKWKNQLFLKKKKRNRKLVKNKSVELIEKN